MFTLEIRTENDAFTDTTAEVARILHETADHIEHNKPISGSLRDLNGNRVGAFNFNPFTD